MAGAIMAMVVGLSIVIFLIIILLAELFCSLLLHRQQYSTQKTVLMKNFSSPDLQPHEPPNIVNTRNSLFAQGVLHAPRSFLFPSIPDPNEIDVENHTPRSPIPNMFNEAQEQPSSAQYFQHCPWLVQEVSPPPSASTSTRHDGSSRIYICNPMYDTVNEGFCKTDTPFETPDTSPSRLETENAGFSDCSSDEDESSVTPPLTPMKRLPPEGSSLSLRAASSLCTTGSDSNSVNGGISSSSSGSPCTSPSW